MVGFQGCFKQPLEVITKMCMIMVIEIESRDRFSRLLIIVVKMVPGEAYNFFGVEHE